MKTLFSYLIPFLLAVPALAAGRTGTSTSYLNCRSDSGRTTFRAEIGDLDGLIDTAEFTIDGYSISWSDIDDPGNRSSVLTNLDYRVFTLSSEKSQPFGFVQLIANPATMSVDNTPKAIQMRFRGTIVGTEPRPNQDSLRSKDILVNCSLYYEKP